MNTHVHIEMLAAVRRIHETAMTQALMARIPECGAFGGIAQDADWLLTAMSGTATLATIDGIAGDVARAIKTLDPIAMPGGHAQHLAAIQSLVRDAILAAQEDSPNDR
ncbi:hypothetical protein [Pigmentiphaga sp.]|uniref:hypothetical protein n=1 Tax=Pigmentiphaga sp. TaxID=1977564 RepID=UPI0025EA6848|nr:hypothetical protein [Pigmentiphaga sp.]